MDKKREEKQQEFELKGFGKRLRKIRQELKITVKKLGEACTVSQSFIRQIELGYELPSILVFVKICDSLQVSPAYLLGTESYLFEQKEWSQLFSQLKLMPPSAQQIADKVINSLVKNFAEKDNLEEKYGMINYEEFGRRVKKARQEMLLTSQSLAKRCGVSPVFIRHVEEGRKLPSLPVFVNICNASRISPAFLLGNELKIEITNCRWDELVRIQCDMTSNSQKITKDVLVALLQNLSSKEEKRK